MSPRLALPPERRRRLAHLLGLLGSAHFGERDTAGRKAQELVHSLGLTWFDVVAPEPITDSACMQHRPHDERPLWCEAAEKILRSGRASQWEIKICQNLLDNWVGKLTERQAEILERAWCKCARQSA